MFGSHERTEAVPATVIRAARAEDLPKLVDLMHQLSKGGLRPEHKPPAVTDGHRAAFEAITRDSTARVLVVEVAGEVQATLTLYLLPNLSHGGQPFLLVENVVTDAAARGQRLGELLMAEAVRIARAANCYKVALASNIRRTDAHRFYDRLGFARSHQGFTLYLDEPDRAAGVADL